MRGSALLFDTLDPETLERLDLEDLCYLEPFEKNENWDKYSLSSSPSASSTSSEFYSTSSSPTEFRLGEESLPSAETGMEANDYFSSSSLNKSNYCREIPKSQKFIQSHHHRSIGRASNPPKNELKLSSSLPMPLPLSRVARREEIKKTEIVMIPSKGNNKEITSRGSPTSLPNNSPRGIARFLFSRKERSDRDKVDIHNLSPQMREELKRIYVY